jgi:hypothetical protein
MMPGWLETAAVTVVGTDTRMFSCDSALSRSRHDKGFEVEVFVVLQKGQDKSGTTVYTFCGSAPCFAVDDEDFVGWTALVTRDECEE